MAKSTFGILLAIAGLAVVWAVVTGRLKKLTSGDIVLSHGTAAAATPATSGTGAVTTAVPPAANGRTSLAGISIPGVGTLDASGNITKTMASTGAYIPTGVANVGISIGGAHLGLDPTTGALYA